jgi:phosphohistidine phosphatase
MTNANERTLMLLRHAKSSWDDGKIGDHERPLDKRGHAAGRLLAAHFATLPPPGLVLCSSALRTRQTLEHILASFAAPPRVLIEDGLYLASPASVRSRIAEVRDDITSLLVIGHNPGLHDLALALAESAPPRTRARVSGKFPTGALAAYGIAGPWHSIASAPIELAAYVTPAELAESSEDSD